MVHAIATALLRTAWLPAVVLASWFHAGSSQAAAPQGNNPFVQAGNPFAADESSAGTVFLIPEYEIRRLLTTAQTLVEEKRYGEAVQHLDRLILRGEDYFLKSTGANDSPPLQSIKQQAQNLLGQMPEAGRQSYERQFGADARRALDAALRNDDQQGLAEIARHYFHTEAGYEATLLIAQRNLDRGAPLAAAECYQRLLDSPAAEGYQPLLALRLAECWRRGGQQDEYLQHASAALDRLRKTHAGEQVSVGGRQVALFGEDDDAIEWFESNFAAPKRVAATSPRHWAIYGGNPQRNAAARGDGPLLTPCWRLPVANDPRVQQRIGLLQRAFEGLNLVAQPSLHPIFIDDLAIMRTINRIVAVDVNTGKRIWMTEPSQDYAAPDLDDQRPGAQKQALTFMRGLDRRLWDDAVYGRLASDGARVFAVEGIAWPKSDDQPPTGFDRFGNLRYVPVNSETTNQLVAYEIASQGKRKWVVGGATGEDEAKLAGVFFLGPPLPLEGRLYALAEVSDAHEIRLVVLDAKTGRLEWAQQLATFQWDLRRDLVRRFGGASPSFAQDLLICPTSSGAVVAVDLTTRQLKWGLEYDRNRQIFYSNAGRIDSLQQQYPGATNGRWLDSSVIVADTYVLVSPPDGASEHGSRNGGLSCLDLLSGKEIWQRARGDWLQVAGVYENLVLLTGRDEVEALWLFDGSPAWDNKTLKLPDGAQAAGRGFFSDQYYYLPLTTGEVAQIDVGAGVIAERLHLREGVAPGNLFAYRDRFYSQSAQELTAFHRVTASRAWIARSLEANPDDRRALRRRGQMHLEAGRIEAAIADLQRAYQQDGDDEEARRWLVDAMLAQLEQDFAAAEPGLKRLQSLAQRPGERIALLRRTIDGLWAAGRRPEALEALLELLAIDTNNVEVFQRLEVSADPLLAISRRQWIRARLTELARQADEDQLRSMNQSVLAWIQRSQSELAEGPQAQRAFNERAVDYFGSFPAADAVRWQLLEALTGRETLLARERLLSDLAQSRDPAQRPAALARLAMLLSEAGRADEALIYYDRLQRDYADVVCGNGKTGSQVVDLARTSLGASWPDHPWPTGRVTGATDGHVVDRSPAGKPRAPRLAFEGASPYFGRSTLHLDPASARLSCRDGQGRVRWELALEPSAEMRSGRHGIFPANSVCAADGHLLVLASGERVIGIDTLRAGREATRSILWDLDRRMEIPGIAVEPQDLRYQMEFGAGRRRSRQTPILGPVTRHGVCLQRNDSVVLVDALSGQTLWERRGIAKGCEIFGDEEIIFVIPPRSTTAQVVRTSDGKLLGERTLDVRSNRVATIGRRVLVKKATEDGGLYLQLVDPWRAGGAEAPDQRADESADWVPLSIAAGSKFDVVDNQWLGVVQPTRPESRFTLVRLSDGRRVVDAAIEPERSVTDVQLLPWGNRMLLLTNNSSESRKKPNIQTAPAQIPSRGADDNRLINGRLYSFDLDTGQATWLVPAQIKNFGYLAGQGRELPALVFSRQGTQDEKTREDEPPTEEGQVDLLVLDKQSGRVVLERFKAAPAIDDLIVVGNPQRRVMSIVLAQRGGKVDTMTLAYSDTPAPPEPPYQADEEVSKRTGAFGTGLQKGVAGVLGGVAEGIKALGGDEGKERDPFADPPKQ